MKRLGGWLRCSASAGLAGLLAVFAGPLRACAAELAAGEIALFENHIRPLLAKHCYSCHSRQAERVRGGLYLDSRQGVLRGGDSGPALVAGDPDKSLLIRAVRYQEPDLQMPPKGKRLSSVEVSALENWIRLGAPDPRTESPPAAGRNPKDHWAFQPLGRIVVPEVARRDWVATPVDAFILQRLESERMRPSAPAERRTLIRRASFDLTGLPPTPEEVETFLQDSSEQAFSRVIERLLDSPRYGERWGRHWLDVARYADTKGDVNPRREALAYPFAWTYRDYVIEAFNEDKPFNRFILEQLAADQVGGTPAALGFLTVGNRFNNNRNDIINDRIDVVSKAFLGLTVSCARCHDHKFDPIPTEDYYSWHGIFASTVEPQVEPVLAMPERTADYVDYEGKRQELAREEARLDGELRELRRQRTRDPASQRARQQVQRQLGQVWRQVVELELTHPGAPPRGMAVEDALRPRDSRVFIRGEAENRGELAPRRFLEVLSGPERPLFRKGSGRLQLAQAIASPSNPLTARVLVNRIWAHHFGQGLVQTPDDFGTMAGAASHPELLDYLALRFMTRGWSVKELHRVILLSNTYQQSSQGNAAYAERDPQNRLLWRANVQRLEVEALRDSLLALGGVLLEKVGGRPFDLTQEPFIARRTVYGFVSRNEMPDLLSQFDMANPDMPTGARHQTAVPQQALFLMNSPLVVEQAKNIVARDEFYRVSSERERIQYLYQTIYQRPPQEAEVQLGLKFLEQEPSGEMVRSGPARTAGRSRRPRDRVAQIPRLPLSAWQEYAHALLMANETWFIQ